MRPTAPPAAPGAAAAASGRAARRRRRSRCRNAAPAAGRRGAAPDAAPARRQARQAAARPPAAGTAAGAAAARGGARGGRGAAAQPAAPPPPQIAVWKWTDEDFADAGDGQMPMGKADRRVDWSATSRPASRRPTSSSTKPSSRQSTGHQPLETRTAMAYWQNGKLYLHGSTQSTVQTVGVGRALGRHRRRTRSCIISEYTGGGFGSKIPGAISMAIPALLSKKANAPVMMRITREDEHYIGRARPGILARVKVGFRKDGRITAIDMFTVSDNGPYDAQGDCRSAGNTVSLALSAGGDAVARAHGADQHAAADVAARAGRHAGHRPHRADPRQGGAQARHRSGRDPQDQRAGRQGAVRSRAAQRQAGLRDQRVRQGSARQGRASCSTGTRRRRRSGKRQGTKVRGIGVAVSAVLRRLDRLRRPVHHQAGRPRRSSSRASAISARTR